MLSAWPWGNALDPGAVGLELGIVTLQLADLLSKVCLTAVFDYQTAM